MENIRGNGGTRNNRSWLNIGKVMPRQARESSGTGMDALLKEDTI